MSPVRSDSACGFWPSEFTAELAVTSSAEYDQLLVNKQGIFWREFDPDKNIYSLWWRTHYGQVRRLTPIRYSLRNRVHEYGGGDWCLGENHVYFVNEADQQIYRQNLIDETEPVKLTTGSGIRFADLVYDPVYRRILCVSEDHQNGSTIENRLISLNINTGTITLIHEGHDFYSSPALSKDSAQLAWISWDHPHMPWFKNDLYQAKLDSQGHLISSEKINNGQAEQSFFQPEFSDIGELYFLSDRSGWWNFYRRDASTRIQRLHNSEADFAAAQWQLGMRLWSFLNPQTLACTYLDNGLGYLALIEKNQLHTLQLPWCLYRSVQCFSGRIYAIAWSEQKPPAIISHDPISGDTDIIRQLSATLTPDNISCASSIKFPVNDNATAYANFYPPQNNSITAQEEKPPLIVFTHGGPTSCTYRFLNSKIQYWTQRGFAVADINYRGSSGFGRQYRHSLEGQWGKSDVEDCVAAVQHLADENIIDPERVFIRGGSAGGYTTLCALVDTNLFKAGASLYGISDPAALIAQTHKFESHYLQWLIGDPENVPDKYRERTPLINAERITCPVIFFQGAKDRVVVEAQTSMMVERLKHLGVPVEYHLFDDEFHGFRQPQNNAKVLKEELAFYQRWL